MNWHSLQIRAALRANGRDPDDAKGAPVEVGLQSETDYPHQGKIDYISTGLDPTTGTIEGRAVLDNADDALLPGLFVHAQIPLGAPKRQLALPDTAIQSDQAGPYVYIVGPKNIVSQVRIETGVENAGMTAVTGLQPDDQVVIDGIQNAAPGVIVAPTEQDIAAPATKNPG